MFNTTLPALNESDDKFYGIYRGIVENNDDPLKAGRIQVRVYPMFQNVESDILPWAVYADALGGGSPDVGGLFLPEEQSNVFVFFENGDHRYPVYFAGAPSMKDGKPDLPKETRNTNYTSNRVIKTKAGIVVELDDTTNAVRIHFEHPSGTQETMKGNGDRTTVVVGSDSITVDGNQTINVNGSSTMTVQGNVQMTSSGEVTIKGTLIRMN